MNGLKKWALWSIVWLASATGFAQVKADYDKNTDFTKYQTYSFSAWEKGSDEKLSSFDKNRILSSFENEFNARGMKKVEQGGDLNVVLYLVISEEKSVKAYTDYTTTMGYRGRRWGWSSSYGMATTTYDESYYKEGTLVASFYENTSKELVWQGVSKSTIDEKAEKREKSIPKHVKSLMKKYPVKVLKKKK